MSSSIALIDTEQLAGIIGVQLVTIMPDFMDPNSEGLLFTGVSLDCAESADDDISLTVTDHPVESGSNVADHVRDEPDRLTINGIVSRTPIKDPISLLAESSIRHELAWQNLQLIAKAHCLCIVETPSATYGNFLIESLSRQRTAQIGEAMKVTIKLKHITMVTATEASLPGRPPGVQGGLQNAGNETANEASTDKVSFFTSLIGG